MLIELEHTTVIANEMKFIRSNENDILKKIRFQINFSKNLDKARRNVYKCKVRFAGMYEEN